nr:hypothetical protein BgiMline_001433 [Biomphalaria glabrata]
MVHSFIRMFNASSMYSSFYLATDKILVRPYGAYQVRGVELERVEASLYRQIKRATFVLPTSWILVQETGSHQGASLHGGVRRTKLEDVKTPFHFPHVPPPLPYVVAIIHVLHVCSTCSLPVTRERAHLITSSIRSDSNFLFEEFQEPQSKRNFVSRH